MTSKSFFCVPVFWWGRGLSRFCWLLGRKSSKVNDYASGNSTVPSQQSCRVLIIPWCPCFSFPDMLSSCFKIKGCFLIIFMIRNSILQSKKGYMRWQKYYKLRCTPVVVGSVQSLFIKHPNRVAIAGGTLRYPNWLLRYKRDREGLARRWGLWSIRMDQWMTIDLGCYMTLRQAILCPSGRSEGKVYMLNISLSTPLHRCGEKLDLKFA